jgi:hypothetical protein
MAPSSSGAGFQPSAAAVQAAHTEVAATSARLAARLQDTATAATSAAGDMAYTETSSAVEIAAADGSGLMAV